MDQADQEVSWCSPIGWESHAPRKHIVRYSDAMGRQHLANKTLDRVVFVYFVPVNIGNKWINENGSLYVELPLNHSKENQGLKGGGGGTTPWGSLEGGWGWRMYPRTQG